VPTRTLYATKRNVVGCRPSPPTCRQPPPARVNPQGRLLRCLSSCKDSGSPRHLRGQRRSSAAGQHSSSSLGSTGQSPHHRPRRQQLDLMQAQQQRAVSRLAVEGLGRSVSSGSCPHPAPQSVGSDGESGEASGSDVAAAGSSSRVSGVMARMMAGSLAVMATKTLFKRRAVRSEHCTVLLSMALHGPALFFPPSSQRTWMRRAPARRPSLRRCTMCPGPAAAACPMRPQTGATASTRRCWQHHAAPRCSAAWWAAGAHALACNTTPAYAPRLGVPQTPAQLPPAHEPMPQGGLESVDDIIGRDLGRTFPEHPLFMEGDGQARLGRLLRAYALRDPETGYCQGMGARLSSAWVACFDSRCKPSLRAALWQGLALLLLWWRLAPVPTSPVLTLPSLLRPIPPRSLWRRPAADPRPRGDRVHPLLPPHGRTPRRRRPAPPLRPGPGAPQVGWCFVGEERGGAPRLVVAWTESHACKRVVASFANVPPGRPPPRLSAPLLACPGSSWPPLSCCWGSACLSCTRTWPPLAQSRSSTPAPGS
jgi:hypothetical protein